MGIPSYQAVGLAWEWNLWYLLYKLEKMVQVVCSEARGSSCKDTMDVLHLYRVFIHLKGARREEKGGRRRERGWEGGREEVALFSQKTTQLDV